MFAIEFLVSIENACFFSINIYVFILSMYTQKNHKIIQRKRGNKKNLSRGKIRNMNDVSKKKHRRMKTVQCKQRAWICSILFLRCCCCCFFCHEKQVCVRHIRRLTLPMVISLVFAAHQLLRLQWPAYIKQTAIQPPKRPNKTRAWASVCVCAHKKSVRRKMTKTMAAWNKGQRKFSSS